MKSSTLAPLHHIKHCRKAKGIIRTALIKTTFSKCSLEKVYKGYLLNKIRSVNTKQEIEMKKAHKKE